MLSIWYYSKTNCEEVLQSCFNELSKVALNLISLSNNMTTLVKNSELLINGIKILESASERLIQSSICGDKENKDLNEFIIDFLNLFSVNFQDWLNDRKVTFSNKKLEESSQKIQKFLKENEQNLINQNIFDKKEINIVKSFLENFNEPSHQNFQDENPHNIKELNDITFSIITHRFFR